MRQAYAGLPGSVLAVLIFCLSLMKMTPVAAELRIDITRGVVEPLPIAILPFQGDSAEAGGVGRDIAGVISADLGNSGLFRPLDVGAQVASQGSLDAPPKFADWRQMNAQALVQGRTAILADGRFKIEFRLWDVFAEQQMVGVAYVTAKNNWRRIAHIIADAIYKRITGEDGYFDTRIVYVAESGPRSRRVKRLAIMDQDGAGNRFLTDGASLVLTPRFSPSMQEIAYVRFIDGSPRVYIRHLDLPREELLGDFPGMTFAPRFSPDGERLIISMAQDGNTDIYTVDLKSRTKRRLTSHSAIDTSASYSPDGRQIVFNSDRSGTPQLYIMDADGSNVRRISYGEGRYTEPAWSPRGDLIAFTKMRSGRFSIGVMRPDGSGERTLADGYQVSGPSWAPNGRVLMFYREDPVESEVRGGRARLFTVDLSGRNEREIVTPLDASDPAWSPLQP